MDHIKTYYGKYIEENQQDTNELLEEILAELKDINDRTE